MTEKKTDTVSAKTKAAAKAAIKDIEAVEDPKAGFSDEKSLEEQVADKFIAVLTEPLNSYTGPNDRNDYSYIPEVIRLKNGTEKRITKRVKVLGHVRAISLDGMYFYRWCHPGRFDRHRRQGFDFVSYDELFKDADYFQRSENNRIRNGDVYLMKISVDGLARMYREKVELQKHFESVHEGDVAEAAEEFNTKAVRIYEDGTSENIN
jgi:hypothetical protein